MNLISGIQQAGIGTGNAAEAAVYYKNLLGFEVLVFDDEASATLMTQYTGDTTYNRRAMLTMNMQGGGGLELWQYKNKKCLEPAHKPRFGDLGIFALKIKAASVIAAHAFMMQQESCITSAILEAEDGVKYFWLEDKYGNHFQIVEARKLFGTKQNHVCAGVCGAVIGVSDMNRSATFYNSILGLEQIRKEKNYAHPKHPDEEFVVTKMHKPLNEIGAFSRLLGYIDIDLVQAKNYTGKKIFANRYWGDAGYIHLCFDVTNMTALKEKAALKDVQFTVDSESCFEMENAGGRFCYMEDPDATLIELVETHKVPILKKLNWYYNLQERKDKKPLPDWMVKLMALSKVKG